MPEAPGLWSYALAVYARPGVAEVCLEAQDGYGADVPLLLWGAWAAARGRTLAPDEVAAALGLAHHWHGPIIAPLRQVRRALKALPADALRQAVKAAELEAERLYLAALEDLARDWPDAPAAPQGLRDNLARLLPPDAASVTERLHKALS